MKWFEENRIGEWIENSSKNGSGGRSSDYADVANVCLADVMPVFLAESSLFKFHYFDTIFNF